MTAAQTDDLILEFARLLDVRRMLIVGSQAIHGVLPDPPLEVVAPSREVDVVPLPYERYEKWYYYAHEHLGADSDFDAEHDVYVDMIKPHVPKLPPDWESRATERTLTFPDSGEAVVVVYPELHDLIVTKLFANGPQDEGFLRGVRALTDIDLSTLRERVASVDLSPEKEHLRKGAYAILDRIERDDTEPVVR
jgi:hypothetical protein